jgi:hypothetical protein
MNKNLYEFSKGPEKEKFHKVMHIIFKILQYLNLAIVGVSLVFAFSVTNVGYFFAVVFALSAILAWFVSTKFYNFYDYSYVEGSIRVIKVLNNQTRRLVVNFDAKNIISYGNIFGETYEKRYNDKSVKKHYASPISLGENDLAILYSENGTYNLLLMPYDENFVAVLSWATGKTKMDKEFKEKLIKNA